MHGPRPFLPPPRAPRPALMLPPTEPDGADDCADESSQWFVGGVYFADLHDAELARLRAEERERRDAARFYGTPQSLLERLRDEGAFDPDDHTPGAFYSNCGWPLLPCPTCDAAKVAA